MLYSERTEQVGRLKFKTGEYQMLDERKFIFISIRIGKEGWQQVEKYENMIPKEQYCSIQNRYLQNNI